MSTAELSSLSCSGAGRPGSAWWRYSPYLRFGPVRAARWLGVWLATLVEMASGGRPPLLSQDLRLHLIFGV